MHKLHTVTTEILGWASSILLVLTIGKQVYKQWHDGSSQGVSRYLFLGQIGASVGFTVYSLLVKNWVFVVTNALMLVNGLVGYGIVLKHRRRERREGKVSPQRSQADRQAPLSSAYRHNPS